MTTQYKNNSLATAVYPSLCLTIAMHQKRAHWLLVRPLPTTPQALAEVKVKKAHTDTGVCVCVRVCLSRLVDINVIKLHIASAYQSIQENLISTIFYFFN